MVADTPITSAAVSGGIPIDTAQSGRITVRLARTAASRPTPLPMRSSTARYVTMARNTPCDAASASASPAVSPASVTDASRASRAAPNTRSGSGSTSSTTTTAKHAATSTHSTTSVEPVQAMSAAATNGPIAQPPRNTPASVDRARARTSSGT